jgi:hypothetical protein
MKVSDLNLISGSLNIFTADSAASLDLESNSSLIDPILRFAISKSFIDVQRKAHWISRSAVE